MNTVYYAATVRHINNYCRAIILLCVHTFDLAAKLRRMQIA